MSFVRNFLLFATYPLMAIVGFTMFRYPEIWAKTNAWLLRNKVDSPKQSVHTKRIGIFFIIAAAFAAMSMLYLNAVLPLK